MNTLDRIFSELSKKNISQKEFCEFLQIPKQTPTDWKSGKSKSYLQLIPQIADFFEVSTDYLYGKETPAVSKSNYIELNDQKIYMIPIFETVSAGLGAFASDYISGYMPMYFDNGEDAKNSICIKVQGDSMYPKIEDGDIVLVRKQDSVDSGSIAVILIDNEEGVVKRIFYGNDWIELQSFNPTYKPMRFVKNDMNRITIIGEVKKIIKNA